MSTRSEVKAIVRNITLNWALADLGPSRSQHPSAEVWQPCVYRNVYVGLHVPRVSSVTSPTSHGLRPRTFSVDQREKVQWQCLHAVVNIVIWASLRVYQYVVLCIRILSVLPASRTKRLPPVALRPAAPTRARCSAPNSQNLEL